MERLRIGILVSGFGSTMEAVAATCAEGTIRGEVVLVGCDRAGVPALQKAEARGIPTLVVRPRKEAPGAWEEALTLHLQAARVDLVVLAGFFRILKGPLLEGFAGRIINLHPSLLPKFGGPGLYGTRVHEAVIASGDPITGSTIFLVTRDVDRGPTLLQRSMEVRKGETAEELSERQKPMERELLVEAVRKFAARELPLPWHAGTLTYTKAGVDTKAVKQALSALVKSVRYHPPASRGRPIGAIGLFAGVMRIGDSLFALTTDNVGTKVILAQELDRWEEVGEDLVAMNVNDLLASGATPSGLVDYIACRKPEQRVLAKIGLGLNHGLSKAKCSLLGGETAVVPEIVSAAYDLSATALGFFPSGREPLDGSRLRAGDVLIGIPSSGFHTNGFTLVRRLLREGSVPLDEPLDGMKQPLGVALLKPTRTYVPSVEPLLEAGLPVALSNITGGAFAKNLLRLRRDVEFVLEDLPPAHGVFDWIARASSLPPEELYRTFNMGVGFVVAVRATDENGARRLLRDHRARDARVIGHVGKGRGVSLPEFGVRYIDY